MQHKLGTALECMNLRPPRPQCMYAYICTVIWVIVNILTDVLVSYSACARSYSTEVISGIRPYA